MTATRHGSGRRTDLSAGRRATSARLPGDPRVRHDQRWADAGPVSSIGAHRIEPGFLPAPACDHRYGRRTEIQHVHHRKLANTGGGVCLKVPRIAAPCPLSCRAVLSNLRAFNQRVGTDAATDVGCSWLPLYHLRLASFAKLPVPLAGPGQTAFTASPSRWPASALGQWCRP